MIKYPDESPQEDLVFGWTWTEMDVNSCCSGMSTESFFIFSSVRSSREQMKTMISWTPFRTMEIEMKLIFFPLTRWIDEWADPYGTANVRYRQSSSVFTLCICRTSERLDIFCTLRVDHGVVQELSFWVIDREYHWDNVSFQSNRCYKIWRSPVLCW